MPRVLVPVEQLDRDGVLIGALGTEVTGDASNNHYFKNTGKETLSARNSGATTRTVTIAFGPTVDSKTVPARTITLLANEHKQAGPWPEGLYDQVSGTEQGFCHVDVDHAEVMLQVLKTL